MKLNRYILDKLFVIIILFVTNIVVALLLKAFKTPTLVILIISIIILLCTFIILIYDYVRKNNFYKEIVMNTENLDKKYLVIETIKTPSFYEGQIMHQLLYDINKSMIENVNDYEKSIEDFKEYIEMWIHEVKIPISSLILMCHNNKNKLDLSFAEQIRRLDNYIDQILYYVRSNYTENDFVFKEVKLDKVISSIALKNKDDLLENKINLEVNLNNLSVYTDYKWLEFILNQIINNSIKYKKNIKNSYIKISATTSLDEISLCITDNGIGIPKRDIPNVFKKSFTGTNGRNRIKSTGIGLYIASNLCRKLGHTIEIESEEGKYTTVIIKFGNNKYYKF